MIVAGSDINLAALSGVKSLADLKKLDIYSQLPKEQADAANKELWDILSPPKAPKAESKGTEE
jgi:hypothetical protein